MAFYLGNESESGAAIAYVPKHLTTHGLIFGMTGSGKTGLAIGLLEEAQRAGIPIIAIDPKGDLGNLALAWPDLSPKYFAQWMDPADLDGRQPLDAAEATANVWRNGLAKCQLGEAEIGAMRQSAHITVYTPGSSAGIPVSLLDEFAPPNGYAELPDEDKSELVTGVVAALLALVKIDADPLKSKESILLTNILADAWNRNESLDLHRLIQRAADPPFARLGVFELDEFFPPKRRRDFAMQLNGLIASPSFQTWLAGVPLDIEKLMGKGPNGASRTSVFSIAHLDDAERMSFVTLLLDRVIAWMRAQPGTGELRAILYMDEVFGYLPPHPLNPPSKRPIMTLMKQARAFGLGVLLATQNPVDVDYKALTNAGTWMIGKLQTDQDKERILDGLMGAQTAAAQVSRSEISHSISALQGREFLIQNAHEGRQRVFKTRFCMSYLRGPLTRQEITRLREADFYNAPELASMTVRFDKQASAPTKRAPPPPDSVPVDRVDRVDEVVETSRPVDRDAATTASVFGLPTRFLPSALLLRPDVRRVLGVDQIVAQGPLTLRPALFGEARITFKVAEWADMTTGSIARIAMPLPEVPGVVKWRSVDAALRAADLIETPPPGGVATLMPAWLQSPADRERTKDMFIKQVIGQQQVTIPWCPPLMRYGEPGESLDSFRLRLTAQLGQASTSALGKAESSRDRQTALFDRQLAEMKQLLEMDKNELAYLRERGDADAFRRANERAKLRIERFKELQATRAKFTGLAQREMADIEFSALDKLAACELKDLTLDPKGVRLEFFGLLWVPSR